MLDLHCHILPGVDDGPKDEPGALSMARGLGRLGFTHICATPHVPWINFASTPGDIMEACSQFQQSVLDEGLGMTLTPAAEHHVSEVPEMLANDTLICYPRGDTFLMEFPLGGFPPRLAELLFRIRVKGKVPVVAHVERYPEVQKDPDAVEQLREGGCLLLVNLSGLVGAWSRKSQKAARELVGRGWIDAVTTDLHTIHDLDAVEEGLSVLRELVGADGVERLLVDRPAEIAGFEPKGSS